jgi:hypothetical protein
VILLCLTTGKDDIKVRHYGQNSIFISVFIELSDSLLHDFVGRVTWWCGETALVVLPDTCALIYTD